MLKILFLYLHYKKDDNVEYTDKELKYGEYGEICITGPTQMLGYYKDKEKTAEVQIKHSDGLIWTHTKR